MANKLVLEHTRSKLEMERQEMAMNASLRHGPVGVVMTPPLLCSCHTCKMPQCPSQLAI